MIARGKITSLDDFFLPPDRRNGACVYLCRINGCGGKTDEFIRRYYGEARRTGAVIEGGIKNPTQENLAYYNEMLGSDYKKDAAFISSALKKWLPRLTPAQNSRISGALYESLCALEAEGKNENMQKSAYVKFMCWLYYRFGQLAGMIGTGVYPKILYEGIISRYELVLVTALCGCGCDAVFLQYAGDEGYLKTDPASKFSDKYEEPGMTPFPQNYSIAAIREEEKQAARMQRQAPQPAVRQAPQPSFPQRTPAPTAPTAPAPAAPPVLRVPALTRSTNKWSDDAPLVNVAKSLQERKAGENEFRNCFYLIKGTDDKAGYTKRLFDLYTILTGEKRGVHIVNGHITVPDTAEIGTVQRGNYRNADELIHGLSRNLSFTADPRLAPIVTNAFADAMRAAAVTETSTGKLSALGVYLICWIKRVYPDLLKNFKNGSMGVFILLGKELTKQETVFLSFLASCPVDVLILQPDLSGDIHIPDDELSVVLCEESVGITEFPCEESSVRIGTAAYHAERELDTMMYGSGGMYRNMQYGKAKAVILDTMFEEIEILWDQELVYRSGFSTATDTVIIPTIFAKVSGVKNGDTAEYWKLIKRLMTPETFMIKQAPFIPENKRCELLTYATAFLKNRRLQRDAIKSHPGYKYGFLRGEIQDHMLDKLQLLLDSGMIKGTYENGREYFITALCLELDKQFVRMIQSFDFTKKNPKILYVNTTETAISLEDTIVLSYLSLIGFDIVFFVPTGYMCAEKWFASVPFAEHQIGDYKYDLTVPDMSRIKGTANKSFFGGLFGKK